MRILQVHNHYQQYGGEDAVVKAEGELLKSQGEEVFLYERSNAEIQNQNPFRQFQTFTHLSFSSQSYREIKKILREIKPDICHVYNTFFMITPAVYQACAEDEVPVVQSLYNYRWMCANAIFLREGKNCEECLEHSRLRAIQHGCYKNSRFMTAIVVRMQNDNWKNKIFGQPSAYITATEFTKRKYTQAGIPAEKILVKPHFMDVSREERQENQRHALYIGRISEEKGIRVLLKAWRNFKDVPLKIIGQGPLLDEVRNTVRQENLNAEVLGYCSDEDYIRCLKSSKFVVVPSICHDNFPRTIVEAYAYGVPVIGSDLDGIREYIKEKKSGFLFTPGDPRSLSAKIYDLLKSDHATLGANARSEFELHYTGQRNYEILKDLYERIAGSSEN